MQYNEFPEFVPDQLLMPDHLNQVFNYLDEQQRLTRACLIGVGIACGLELSVDIAGTAIHLSSGCGVTTEGYLIQMPAATYTEYVAFDPVKPRYYDRWVDVGAKKKKMDLYELVPSATIQGSVVLSQAFLADKVVLVFVELLEEQSKNCDPNSCDNKGIEVTVTFRPLLVSKADATTLVAGAGGSATLAGAALPEIRLPRVDVPATSLVNTAAVFEAFLAPFTSQFLQSIEAALSKSYQLFRDLVADIYPSDPFAGLAQTFSFLATRKMTYAELIDTQYYYDLFSDLLQSYGELRRTGTGLAGVCCPPDDFPRHLLLGEASGYSPSVHSDYRHYFVPSPILAKQPGLLAELRSLQIRLARLTAEFLVPQIPTVGGALPREFVGITPSSLGDVPLSKKAIPYYYAVTKAPNPLYTYWDSAKTRANAANQNLSYHASKYNSTDDFVQRPLLYDLEPYNFLRIEGHIGQSYNDSLASILTQRNKYRLPIEVLALSTDIGSAIAQLGGFEKGDALLMARAHCQFRELEAAYAVLAKHLVCFLSKETEYYYALPISEAAKGDATLVPTTSLLKTADPAFRYSAGTYGQDFEDWYTTAGQGPHTPFGSFLAISGYTHYLSLVFASQKVTPVATLATGVTATPTPVAAPVAAPVPVINRELQVAFFNQFVRFILYYIQQLYETLSSTLSQFDVAAFQARYEDLQKAALAYKDVVARGGQNVTTLNMAELNEHLDKLVYACDTSEFASLAAEFQKRWREVDMLRRLAYFAKKCPGLQHKAGVPMGGTFVLVYHENSRVNTDVAKFANVGGRDRIIKELIPDLGQESTLDQWIGQIPQGTVIADFYFPFICCSDCPPISFEVPPPPVEAPRISLTPTEFCGTDAGPTAITVSPAGGTVAGEGVVTHEASSSAFVPKSVDVGNNKVKEVTLAYTLNSLTATAKVKVYHPPVADFKITAIPSVGPGQIQVADASTFVDSLNWDFGDGTATATTPQASHNYTKSGSYNITLTVKNGPCTAQKVIPVAIQIEVPKPTISITPTEFCGNNPGAIAVAVSPPGGAVGGEGVAQDTSGITFFPSKVEVGNNKVKEVALTYTLNGLTATARVNVYHPPVADFKITAIPSVGPGQIQVVDASTFVDSLNWDFGDSTATANTPQASHNYTKSGSYNITLTVKNGPCTAQKAIPVAIQIEVPKPTISITPTEFCSNNPGAIAVAVSPLGGKVVGEGVTQDTSGITFLPSKVELGNNKVKEVVLTYNVGGQAATTKVNVYQTPAAQISLKQDNNGAATFQAVARFGDIYSWEFGDGTSAETQQPTAQHTYKKAGNYTVALRVKNGPCVFSTQVPVQIVISIIQ